MGESWLEERAELAAERRKQKKRSKALKVNGLKLEVENNMSC